MNMRNAEALIVLWKGGRAFQAEGTAHIKGKTYKSHMGLPVKSELLTSGFWS